MRWQVESPKKEWLLFGGLIALALLARFVPGERIVDDAYITFRYARNIVEGNGFVYNPSEHVLGTTTPLYTLLLSGLALVTGSTDFPTLAVALNAFAGATSVGLLYALGKKTTGHWLPAAAAGLLWAVAPYSATFAIGGMETDLTIALLLATSISYLTDSPYFLATLSALALLARPDSALLLLPLWLGYLVKHRRLPIREGATALAVLAPWLVFATFTFGSPVPASVAAKSDAYRLSPLADLVRLVQHYSTPFFAHKLLGPGWQFVGFIFYLMLFSLGGLHSIRRDRHKWPLLAYPMLYFAVFAVVNPSLFRWYLSPPLPFYFLFILVGAWSLIRDIGTLIPEHVGKPADWRVDEPGDGGDQEPVTSPVYESTIFVLFTVMALAFTLNAWALQPDHGPDRPAPKMAWFELELLYAQAADIVLDHAQPGDTLCAGDIGALGYFTGMPILDTVGLVTPESGQYYPTDPDIYVINYAIPADLVLALDPDLIVILEVYGRRGLLQDETFRDRYRLLKTLETDIYGSDGMLIFGRSSG